MKMRMGRPPFERERGEGRKHHPEFGFGHHGHGHGRGRDRGERHHEGRGGGRVRRGDARYLLLDALRDGPKHGYDIIKGLETRSHGRYAPSPGTVYPTLQYLEDLGLVRSEQGTQRRIFHLTDAGRAELEAHKAEVDAFWQQVAEPAVSNAVQSEIGLLEAELEHLNRTVWIAVKSVTGSEEGARIRQIRLTVEQCQEQIRQIISGTTSNEIPAKEV